MSMSNSNESAQTPTSASEETGPREKKKKGSRRTGRLNLGSGTGSVKKKINSLGFNRKDKKKEEVVEVVLEDKKASKPHKDNKDQDEDKDKDKKKKKKRKRAKSLTRSDNTENKVSSSSSVTKTSKKKDSKSERVPRKASSLGHKSGKSSKKSEITRFRRISVGESDSSLEEAALQIIHETPLSLAPTPIITSSRDPPSTTTPSFPQPNSSSSSAHQLPLLPLPSTSPRHLNYNPRITFNPNLAHTLAQEGKIKGLINHINVYGPNTLLIRDNRGDTILHVAVQSKQHTVVEFLLTPQNSNIVDPNSTNQDGLAPLHYAASFGSVKMIRLLLNDKRVRPSVLTCQGNSTLHYLVRNFPNLQHSNEEKSSSARENSGKQKRRIEKMTSIAMELVKRGCPIGVSNSVGETALHTSAIAGKALAVDWLRQYKGNSDMIDVQNEIDVNAVTVFGETALHLAVRAVSYSTVRSLLKCGIDVRILSDEGITVLDLAVRDDKMIQILRYWINDKKILMSPKEVNHYYNYGMNMNSNSNSNSNGNLNSNSNSSNSNMNSNINNNMINSNVNNYMSQGSCSSIGSTTGASSGQESKNGEVKQERVLKGIMKKGRKFAEPEEENAATTEEETTHGTRLSKAEIVAGMREKKKVTKKEEVEGVRVREWLSGLQLPVQYWDLFVKDGFDDLEAVRLISEQDLIDLGVNKTGHRKKIMHWVENENRKYTGGRNHH